MSNIEWGPEIKVNGERPAWLADDDKFNWYGCAYTGTNHQWEGVDSIRLPADHWAYDAIRAGFEPWGGGDSAPEDWDGGKVFVYDDTALDDAYHVRKITNVLCWKADSEPYVRIVGYRKRAQPKPDADTVTIPRMTEAEALDMWHESDEVADDRFVSMLEELGLIKPEPTKAERIAADTGIDLATVERVLAAAS